MGKTLPRKGDETIARSGVEETEEVGTTQRLEGAREPANKGVGSVSDVMETEVAVKTARYPWLQNIAMDNRA